MLSIRGHGSWPTVFTVLVLFLVSAVHSANITDSNANAPNSTAPSCKAKFNPIVKITEIPDSNHFRRTHKPPSVYPSDHVRRANDSLSVYPNTTAPSCKAKSNSTLKISVTSDPHRVRRADKPLRVKPSQIAPRCKAKFNSTVSAINSAVNAVNVTAIKVGRIRRADNSPGRASAGSGSGGTKRSGKSESGDEAGSDFSNSPPPSPLEVVPLTEYIRQGGIAAAYTRASDEEVTADLVKKSRLKSGEQIASPFTDHSAFKSNGWEESDVAEDIQGVEFGHHVPFIDALQSLGISTQAQPKGNHQNTLYEHRLPWVRNGKSMQPVGRAATFQYVTSAEDACIIMTMMYSPQHIIQDRRLAGIESPPLSHSSDMSFLEWKRACDKSQTDPKSLRHIFIHVVVTPSTQSVVASILHSMGKPITDRYEVWGTQLPRWEQKLTYQPDSDEGKALLGTIQLKGLMWMLVQHREHLGQKAVKSISVFRGVYPESGPDTKGPKIHGPDFYVELEDVQLGADVGRIRRSDKSSGGQSPGGQSPGGQSPEAQSPGEQSPGGKSPGGQSTGGQSPEAQSPGGHSIGSSVYDAQISDNEDWPAKYDSDPGTSAVEPDSGDEMDIDYHGYVDDGIELAKYLELSDDEVRAALEASGHLEPDEQLASPFTEVSEFKNNGWQMEDRTPELLKNFNDQAPVVTALKSLGISDKERPQGKHEFTGYDHTLPYMLDGHEEKPVGAYATFGFVTDPQDACLIISVAYSTQYWIERKELDKHFGIESPPMSHQSDLAFLDWKRACTKYNKNTNTLKHIFFSIIRTHEMQEVVHHIYGAKMGHGIESMSDLPPWDQRITLEPGTDEFLALFATVQVKGIMWMLLQHREHLGHKTIKKMCIFLDERTGVDDDYEPRGPSVYIELEDVKPGAGPSGAGKTGARKSGAGPSGAGQADAGQLDAKRQTMSR